MQLHPAETNDILMNEIKLVVVAPEWKSVGSIHNHINLLERGYIFMVYVCKFKLIYTTYLNVHGDLCKSNCTSYIFTQPAWHLTSAFSKLCQVIVMNYRPACVFTKHWPKHFYNQDWRLVCAFHPVPKPNLPFQSHCTQWHHKASIYQLNKSLCLFSSKKLYCWVCTLFNSSPLPL